MHIYYYFNLFIINALLKKYGKYDGLQLYKAALLSIYFSTIYIIINLCIIH